MAITFLNNLQFSQNQLLGARLQLVANDSDISSPVSGQIIYNSGTNLFKYYNGSSWIDPAAAGVTYTLPVSSGSNAAVLTLTGDDGTTDPVTIQGSANGVSVTANNASQFTVALQSSVTLQSNLTTGGDITVNGGDIILGGTGRIQGIDTVSASTDAVNKAYVDAAVTGGLTFKDGFNANTGDLDNSSNYLYSSNPPVGTERVAVAVGDYYVVTTAGNFYGNSSYPLDVGDSIIAREAADAGTSVVTDWVIVQGDEGVVTITSGNSGSNSTGNAITSQTNQAGAVTIQSFSYNGGSNVGHVPSGGTNTKFLRGDGSWSIPTDSGFNRFKQVGLNSSLAYVSKSVSGGITTFTVDVSNSSVFGSAAQAQYVMCNLTTKSGGERVYAEITNGAIETAADGNLIIKMVGTISDDVYEAQLVRLS